MSKKPVTFHFAPIPAAQPQKEREAKKAQDNSEKKATGQPKSLARVLKEELRDVQKQMMHIDKVSTIFRLADVWNRVQKNTKKLEFGQMRKLTNICHEVCATAVNRQSYHVRTFSNAARALRTVAASVDNQRVVEFCDKFLNPSNE